MDKNPPLRTNPVLRIAIFASVSSPQQATIDKDSLPSQLRDGRLWADSVAGDVVATFEVPGHSRKVIFFQDAEREIPAYAQLRQACEESAFDVLWCRARDRLGRTDALIAQVEALVVNAGAEVYSAALPHQLGQSNEASAIYLSAIERAAAQTESVTRNRRREMGMKARIRRGLPSSQWTYGYRPIRNDQGKTVGGEFGPEIEAVRLATRLFLEGRSYNDIVDALNESPWRPKRADQWIFAGVRKILLNDFYAGYVTYRDLTNSEPSDKFPALWDPETHQRVIRERQRRAESWGGAYRSSRISGIVVCSRCGWKMIAHRGERWGLAYRCAKHNQARRYGRCHPNWINAELIFQALHEALRGFHDDPAAIEEMLAQTAPDRPQLEEDLERARAAAKAVQAKRERLALTLADGKMTADVYRAADDRLIEELEHVTSQATEIQTRLARLPSLEERRTDLEDLAADPDWILEGPVGEVQAKLRRSGLRVIVEEGKVEEIVIEV